jgi:hypothetical protein
MWRANDGVVRTSNNGTLIFRLSLKTLLLTVNLLVELALCIVIRLEKFLLAIARGVLLQVRC